MVAAVVAGDLFLSLRRLLFIWYSRNRYLPGYATGKQPARSEQEPLSPAILKPDLPNAETFSVLSLPGVVSRR